MVERHDTPLQAGGDSDILQEAMEFIKMYEDAMEYIGRDEFDLSDPDDYAAALIMNHELDKKMQKIKSRVRE